MPHCPPRADAAPHPNIPEQPRRNLEVMADARAIAALSVALSEGINQAVARVGRDDAKLAEARLGCPSLFAEGGEVFEYRLNAMEGDGRGIPELFEYIGRTTGGGSAPCSGRLCGNCGKGRHVTPSNWPFFRYCERSFQPGCNPTRIRGSDERSMRAVIDALPSADYNVYNDDGSYDEDLICLPPEKCYGFRPVLA